MNSKEIMILILVGLGLIFVLIILYAFFKGMFNKPKRKKELHIIEKRIVTEEVIKKDNRKLDSYDEEMRLDLRLHKFSDKDIKKVLKFNLGKLESLKDNNHYTNEVVKDLLTKKISEDFKYNLQKDIKGYSIVENKTQKHLTSDVTKYANGLKKATAVENKDKSVMTFKYESNSFALISLGKEDEYKLTVKCGSLYALKLMQLYGDKVVMDQIAQGIVWFTFDNISLELSKSIIDISYTIAKAGY